MKDRNIILAVLAVSMIALMACGTIFSGNKTGGSAGSETELSGESTTAVGMANPWKETDDLEEAEKGSGVDFSSPVDNAFPDGYHFVKYRYMEGIFEAIYEKEDEEIVIRISPTRSGIELSGDYNTYSKEWEENFKGLVVTCRGDGTKSNCTNADLEDIHFAVLCNPGAEGKGLTADQLKSLFMSMQASPL